MRLTLNDDEVQELMKAIETSNNPLYEKIQAQYNDDINRDISKKQEAIKNATIARERTAKEKIINAMNLLRMEDKPLTVYRVAKESGCSYNTVKKYIGGTDGR